MGGWPLTGRDEELDAITDVIATRGGYRGVGIVGPAGVGKTRLAHEAATAAGARGWAVRWIIGTATTRGIPMGAFAEWTDGLDGNPLRLVRQITDALTATVVDAELLIAVDDAQLLDDLSAFVLRQLVVNGAAAVVATIRSGGPVPEPVTALWKEGHLRRLDLQPLSQHESDRLLHAALGSPVSADCSGRLWDKTRGNVLYLRQLVSQERDAGRLLARGGLWHWSGHLDVSPTLIDLVEMHLGATTEPVHDVVDLVAVAAPLERACLAELADPVLVDEAERRGLIAAAGDVVIVGHPLYGEVRLARAGRIRLRRLRGRVASTLARDPRADPVRVGMLWLESDRDPDPGLFRRAAEQATVRLDLVLAERFADAAASGGAGPDAQIMQAHLLVLLNQGGEADRLLTSIDRQTISEAQWANVLHLRAANLLWPLTQPAAAAELIETALAEAAPSPTLTAPLRAVRAVQLAMAARPAEVPEVMNGVDRSQLGVLPALVAVWGLTIAYGDLGSPSLAAEYAGEGYLLAASSPEATYQGVGLAEFHLCALAFAGLLDDARTVAERTFQQCAEAPGISRSVAGAVKGLAALLTGDLRTALACLQPACAVFEAYGDTTGVFYRFSIVCTEAVARSGDAAAALDVQAKMHASRHPTFSFVQSDSLIADAWVAAGRSRITAAQMLARRAAEFARDHTQRSREVWCLQTLVQFGDRDPAIAARLDELAEVVDGPRARLAARYAHALANDNADALNQAAAELQRMGDHLAAADAFAQASAAYTHQGRRGSALTAAEHAAAIMGPRGAVSPATRAVMAPLPLTPRQREIATMVADGMSNYDIADSLAIPVRTVEGHIYRATTALGLANRQALAAVVTESAPRKQPPQPKSE
ncbi:LuxR C-terminal-related transcriptional regulator [Mycobacterium sp.]|uniref:helix-turn-helix transcriptional regulator n=1 Tax=Mycobacterium sp. TaxID=1785 RepID=UPI003D0D8E04